ncbi:hypothetical protein NHX12_020826 [Muraenolepis orangiensis]|uniref:Uncharacterized protein n=1 Tax=Muraenolepis orangiensis TaxID=630683 RepID=A0A9Q0ESA7_9TELE|nr:hypothetical protein NHX12_020826 [Muraenolepis orangiensis]
MDEEEKRGEERRSNKEPSAAGRLACHAITPRPQGFRPSVQHPPNTPTHTPTRHLPSPQPHPTPGPLALINFTV